MEYQTVWFFEFLLMSDFKASTSPDKKHKISLFELILTRAHLMSAAGCFPSEVLLVMTFETN